MHETDLPEPAISIVIPVYCSESTVTETVEATLQVFRPRGEPFEIVLVNDGSPDQSWAVIADLARVNREVRAVDLLRNYGQHSAVMCGLAQSRGEYVFTIDDDMQNPPSELPKMLEAARSGNYDLVVGKFPQKKHSITRRGGSALIAAINRRVFGNPDNITMTNVRCIRRDVVDRIVSFRTSKPYITGLCLRFSGRPANVEIEHRERAQGRSNYSSAAIASLVFRILFGYSSWPLRLVSALGILTAGVAFVYGLFVLARSVFLGTTFPGWASVIVLLAFFNGISLLILSMLGEYTVRVLNQVSSEPPYLVRAVVGGLSSRPDSVA